MKFNALKKTAVPAFVGLIMFGLAGHAAAQPEGGEAPRRWGTWALSRDAAWYASDAARAIADSVIQYQSPEGGWPKSKNLSVAPRTPEDVPKEGGGTANSLDNDATTVPIEFLARMVHATGEATYRDSFLRGLDYLFKAQYANGGWPQFWPRQGAYHTRITYNDDAMIRALSLVRDVAEGGEPYGFVDDERRERAKDSVARGIDCILKTQIRQNGKLTAWCAQHHEETLEPAWARAYEPPSLSGSETVGVARFLMSIEKPSSEVIAAVEGAVDWLRRVAIHGMRLESVPVEGQRPDRVMVADPDAPPLWARFYELETDRPVYMNRDSVFNYDYEKLSLERRSGYRFLGTFAGSLLERDYPKWRAKHVEGAQ
jgi:PelA/Pel-15E family pectate lyase